MPGSPQISDPFYDWLGGGTRSSLFLAAFGDFVQRLHTAITANVMETREKLRRTIVVRDGIERLLCQPERKGKGFEKPTLTTEELAAWNATWKKSVPKDRFLLESFLREASEKAGRRVQVGLSAP